MNNEPAEKTPQEKNQLKSDSFFTDWAPYMQEELVKKLKEKGFTFIPPKPNGEYRQKIELIIPRLSKEDKFFLQNCLKFLEKGLLIDNFGNDEQERHKALLDGIIEINGQTISLYEFSKTVNKLAGNPISSVLTAAQILNNQNIRNEAEKIAKKIKELKQNPGFFKPEDLEPVNQLAQQIIDLILAKYQKNE
jgi:transcription elongation factor GreA-like protein